MVASSAGKFKTGEVVSGDSEISAIRVEGEPDLAVVLVLVLLKLPCLERRTEEARLSNSCAAGAALLLPPRIAGIGELSWVFTG